MPQLASRESFGDRVEGHRGDPGMQQPQRADARQFGDRPPAKFPRSDRAAMPRSLPPGLSGAVPN